MKFSVKFLIAACLAAAVILGCKRENLAPQGPAAGTERLQAWMKEQPVAEGKSAKALPGAVADWPRAVYYPAEKAWVAPMSIQKKSGGGPALLFFTAAEDAQGGIAGGHYVLVLPDGKKMSPATLDAFAVTPGFLIQGTVPPGFSGAILQYDMQHRLVQALQYEQGQLLAGRRPVLQAKGGAADAEPAPDPTVVDPCQGQELVCTDWYWQTWVDGILISEEYLFTTCSCGGDEVGGGNAQEYCQAAFDAFVNAGQAVSGAVTEITTDESAGIMNKSYNWLIYQAGTWGLISYEKAVLEKVYYPSSGQSLWEYKSFVHSKIVSVGASLGGTRTFVDIDNTINFTKAMADVRIDFSVTHKMECFGKAYSEITIPYNSNKRFKVPASVTYGD